MKKVIIIGGGLSGLASGVYAIKAGFDVTIIEKNDEVGGLCTSWEKDGTTIDGCIHWLTGSSRGCMLPIYEDLGALANIEIFKPPFFYKFYYKDISIELSRDINLLKEQLLKYSNSPEDENGINIFIRLVKKFRNVPFHTGKPINTMKKTEVVGYIKQVASVALSWKKTINMSLLDFANTFKSDVLKHFFLSFMPPYYSLTYFVGVVSQFVSDNADTIYALSKDFSLNIKNKYLSLGGKIINNEEIIKLNIKDEKIESIESLDQKYYADYFINAAPLHYFYDKLLPIKYHDEYVDKVFNDTKTYPLISTVYVSMDVSNSYKGKLNHFSLIYDEEGISVGNSHNETIHYRAYPYLKNKNGGTTLIALIDLHVDEYDIFKKALEDGTYINLKNEIANKALNIFINKFPDIKDYIKIVDIATPLTFEKKTYTYKGAYLSNLSTPLGERKTFNIKDMYIDNLYYASQWITQIGGIPRSLSNGKFAVDELVYQIALDEKRKKKEEKRLKNLEIVAE